MSEQHTPGRISNDAQSLLNCVANMRYIESVGKRESVEGRDFFGWSPKDSYDDSEGWARYYADRLIAKATGAAS